MLMSFYGQASAAFNPNNIIDDPVFDRVDSMSAAQIDSFLNSFTYSCISTNSGFKAIDPTGYSPTTGFTYGGFVTAGQVIYDAAQAYTINPQVLLTTLQKEQSLVVGGSTYCNDGDEHKYAAAVGFGCPDGGTKYYYNNVNLYQRNGVTHTSVGPTCVNSASKAGFTQQIIRAAWLLKFGEQRSKGNINWAVVKGNWDNSDDPQTCYGGPMTQGTWQRCPSGATTYYDGYTTIDGSATHMDNGATAALYWYTPHFSGNSHFYDIFTGWFGSTSFPQPLGGALYSQASTAKIFLVTDSTRYYIPSWDVMTNYGLDGFPAISATDTEIQQYTDGGTLTNLVWDGSGVYLVNNRVRYHVSGGMCTAWAFSCYDNTIVKSLGATFQTQHLQTGWELAQLSAYNGVVYEMSNGQRLPIANPQTLSDLGYANTSILLASAMNAGQPLGPLRITTPVVISFPPSSAIYYFDGSNYYVAPSMTSYNDWSFDNIPHLLPPTSSYNTTPPSAQVLSPWYQDSSGNKFIVDQGRRVKIPASLQSLWQSNTFATQPQSLANKLPQTDLQSNIWSNGIFQLSNSKKHYVPTWSDYLALGINYSNTTSLLPDKTSAITQGNDALGDGIIITIQSDSQGLYVINNGKTTHIPDPNTFNDFGFSWNGILNYPDTILNDYPLASLPLSSAIATDGTYYVVGNRSMYKMSPTMAADFGAINGQFNSVSNQTVRNSHAAILSKFLYNSDDGRIYYASGGAIHYVATYNAYVAYGGTKTPSSQINNAAMALFNVGQPVY